MKDIIVVDKFRSIYSSAKDRGIEFDLSFRTVKRLLTQPNCFYTGKPFKPSGKDGRTFDRIDASKGYVEGNVVACCQDINHKKKDLTIAEIELLYHKIKRKLKRTKKP